MSEENPMTTAEVAAKRDGDLITAERSAKDEEIEVWKAGTDLVERQERLPAADAWQRMEAIAQRLARSKLMPKHIRESRDPEADMLVMLLVAHDLGLSATVAINKVNVIEGKPAIAAELMRMLVRRDEHELWVDIERDDQGRAQAAVAHGVRKEAAGVVTERDALGEVVVEHHTGRVHEARFSIEDAVNADLCRLNEAGDIVARSSSGKKLPWEAYTEDMLTARATSRLCRRVFEDCLAGVSYTPDELGVIAVEQEYVPPEPADLATIEGLRAEVDALSDDEKTTMRLAWKAAQLGSLTPGGKVDLLLRDDVGRARALIRAAVRDTPAEAEVVVGPGRHVFEGADGSVECATCGQSRPYGLHLRPEDDPAHDPAPEAAAAVREAQGVSEAVTTGEWVERLGVAKVREVLVQSGLSIEGDDRRLRDRLASFLARVADGERDPRRCVTCGGYPWSAPPGYETCSCPL